MKKFKVNPSIIQEENRSFSFYHDNLPYAIFDIETSGLSSTRNRVILTGVILIHDGKAEGYQFLSDKGNDEDEKLVLKETASIIEKAAFVITYNGCSFDMPFVKRRSKILGLQLENDKLNLDLLQVVRTYSDLAKMLPDLKQKTLEVFAGKGNQRTDRISGKESVLLYEEYLKTGNYALEKNILTHNRDDIVQLYNLTSILRYTDFEKYMYCRGFPMADGYIEKTEIKKGQLHIKGKAPCNRSYISFATPKSPSHLVMEEGYFTFTGDIISQAGYSFIDIQEVIKNPNSLPNCSSGFLITESPEGINYAGINRFGKALAMELSRK